MDKLIYLCGPISGLTYQDANGWRTEFGRRLNSGIAVLSPMRAKNFLQGENALKDNYDHILATQRGITARDRYDTMRADLIVANFLGAKTVSIGSCIELGWADAARVPVIAIMEREGNKHEHAMVNEIVSFKVHCVEDAALVANAILTPGF